MLRLAAAGVTGQDIARRFGVSGATISRIVAGASTPLALPVEPDGDSAPGADSDVAGPGTEPAPGSMLSPVALVPVAVGGPARRCRYAGAMLLWPFLGVVGFEDVFAGVVGGPARRFDDLSVLAAAVFGFALGASSLEGIKHLGRADLGGLVAREHAPELRTLRPRLGAIADACDPVEIQTALSRGLRASDEAPAQVFFVDDHFVPYSGAAPLAKGWDTKRRHAIKGRTDTYIVDLDRRALCFSSTEPTGLSRTIGGAVAQLRAICGPGTAITLGFDRGGSYPAVFSALRDEGVTWITWRRGDITAPAVTPRWSWCALDGARHTYLLADETVDLAGYGPARQISIFENGEVVAQVLTCDTTATAARIVHLLRCRWRIENAFKYLGDHHGIGWLCEYRMDLIANNHEIANRPAPPPSPGYEPRKPRSSPPKRPSVAPSPNPARWQRSRHASTHSATTPSSPPTTSSKPKLRSNPSPPRSPPPTSTPTPPGPFPASNAAASRWSYASSPTTPSSGSPTASTPTSAIPTRSEQSPATSSTNPAPSPTPPPPSTSPSPAPTNPESPEPSPTSSTNSTPPPHTYPATTGPPPTPSAHETALPPSAYFRRSEPRHHRAHHRKAHHLARPLVTHLTPIRSTPKPCVAGSNPAGGAQKSW